MHPRFALPVVLGVSLWPSPSKADVWTVDDDAPAHFASIQDAVNAALDGDAILVEPGSYSGFTIQDKDLRVIGRGPAPVLVQGGVVVQSLAASRAVVLANLDIQPPSIANGQLSAGYVLSCSGAVRIQDCVLHGANGAHQANLPALAPEPGLVIEGSPNVVVSESNVVGGDGVGGAVLLSPSGYYGWSQRGENGITATGSSVALYFCEARAGQSGTQTAWSFCCDCPGSDGGHGCQASASFLFFAASALRGGKGGSYQFQPTTCGGTTCISQVTGNGGNGVLFSGQPSLGAFVQPDLDGGSAGSSNCSNVFIGQHGRAFKATTSGSSARRYSPLGRRMTIDSLLVGTNQSAANFAGAPGDEVYVALSSGAGFSFEPQAAGVWHLPPPLVLPAGSLGFTDANGLLATTVSFPPLAAGEPNRTWYVQSIHVEASGRLRLGTAWTTTLIP
jgi:hypothetical protein